MPELNYSKKVAKPVRTKVRRKLQETRNSEDKKELSHAKAQETAPRSEERNQEQVPRELDKY